MSARLATAFQAVYNWSLSARNAISTSLRARSPGGGGCGGSVSGFHVISDGSSGASTYVLVNPDGRWVGSGSSTALSSGDLHEMVVLRGEDAYDGLTATVLIENDFSSPATFVGVIFPGEPPKVPEPVEPPAE